MLKRRALPARRVVLVRLEKTVILYDLFNRGLGRMNIQNRKGDKSADHKEGGEAQKNRSEISHLSIS